jgi:osmotically-inducible protein OsmY
VASILLFVSRASSADRSAAGVAASLTEVEIPMNLRPTLLTAASACALAVLAVTALACSSSQPIGEQFDDAAVVAKIKGKFAFDPEINPFNIDVDVREAIVTLSGRVDDEATRAEAVKLARDTDGVKRVVDRIEVAPLGRSAGRVLDDAVLTTEIKAKLATDRDLDAFSIDVDTRSGVVTLSGRVATAELREKAEGLATGIRGVERVINDLEVGVLP